MSKGRSQKVKQIPLLILNIPCVTKLLGDLQLYERIPSLLPLRDRVIRLRDQIEDRVHTGIVDVDSLLRQRTEELTDAFRRLLTEQLDTGNAEVFVVLKKLFRERHNIAANKVLFHRWPDGEALLL